MLAKVTSQVSHDFRLLQRQRAKATNGVEMVEQARARAGK